MGLIEYVQNLMQPITFPENCSSQQAQSGKKYAWMSVNHLTVSYYTVSKLFKKPVLMWTQHRTHTKKKQTSKENENHIPKL